MSTAYSFEKRFSNRWFGCVPQILLLACSVSVAASEQRVANVDTPLRKRVLGAVGLTAQQLTSAVLSGVSQGGTYSDFTGKLNPEVKRVEFRVLLPGSFVRIDAPAGVVQRNGFSAGLAIQSQESSRPDVRVSPGSPYPGLVPIMRRVMTRWMVGLFASSDFGPNVQVTVKDRNYALDFVVDGETIILELDSATLLPTRMRYRDVVSLSEATQRSLGIKVAGDGTDEVVIEFSDRIVVNGVSVPRVWQRTVKGARLERITLDLIKINPPLTQADFRF
jgi:hypothetical protein